jgi:polyhydroxyalkanoate synthase
MISTAMLEGVASLLVHIQKNDVKTRGALAKILFSDVGPREEDNSVFLQHYEKKSEGLLELLKCADNGTDDYKRFSFLIQLIWNHMNPKLSPFYYDNGTFEEGLLTFLVTSGFTSLPQASENWSYQVGENIATTQGYVVFENEILQLLYYPAGSSMKPNNPVFVVPPWINKYYIFDLSENNSYIAWLVSQNISVYCISWVNPDSTFSKQSLADYVHKGIHSAAEKACQHAKTRQINFVGYCVGGVALLLYAGWLGSQKSNTIASLTFLATPFDFEKLDNLRLFMSKEHLENVESIVRTEGVFTGSRMLHMFTLLRANDVLIQAAIDQIYLKKQQKPMDFLYWNADVTHLPGQMHLDYLEHIFLENSFMTQPKTILGLPMDFSALSCPVYVVGTQKDHIVPWQSCYAAFEIFKNATFCLSGSGHVTGIINPPHQNKYGYNVYDKRAASSEAWLDQSQTHAGSWWTHWHQWLLPSLGESTQNPPIDTSAVIEMAPGRYVLQKAPQLSLPADKVF